MPSTTTEKKLSTKDNKIKENINRLNNINTVNVDFKTMEYNNGNKWQIQPVSFLFYAYKLATFVLTLIFL